MHTRPFSSERTLMIRKRSQEEKRRRTFKATFPAKPVKRLQPSENQPKHITVPWSVYYLATCDARDHVKRKMKQKVNPLIPEFKYFMKYVYPFSRGSSCNNDEDSSSSDASDNSSSEDDHSNSNDSPVDIERENSSDSEDDSPMELITNGSFLSSWN